MQSYTVRFHVDAPPRKVWRVHETYHAFNPVLRFLLERPVHAKISRDNVEVHEHALRYAGPAQRLPMRLLGGS